MRKRRHRKVYRKAQLQEDQAYLEISEHKPLNSFLQKTRENQDKSLTIAQLKEQRKKQAQFGHNLHNISLNSEQPKLTIGKQGDRKEKEADMLAARVVNQLKNTDKQGISPKDKQIKSLSSEGNQSQFNDHSKLDKSIQQARMGGEKLDQQIRLPMEKAFGVDFSEVKIHHNSQSDSLNQSLQAKAFTTGKNVFFRQGQFNYRNQTGQELIAHELTHVIQQQNQPMIQCQSENTFNKESIQLRQDVEGAIKRLKEGVTSFYYNYDNVMKYLKEKLTSESIPNQEVIRPNLRIQAVGRFMIEEALDKLTQKAPMTQAITYGVKDWQEKWWQESLKNLQTQGEVKITDYLELLIKEIERQKEEILKLIDKIAGVILNDFDNNDQQANFVKYLQEGVSAFKNELPDPSALRQKIIKAFNSVKY